MTQLARTPLYIAWAVIAVWTAIILWGLALGIWDRYSPGNPYYGEAASMWPRWYEIVGALIFDLGKIVFPALLFIYPYRKLISRRSVTLPKER